jgi:hypothetical protein
LKHVGALQSGLVYMSRCNSGWFCHNRNPRDLTVEQNSPLIQNSNEEVTKIKIVAFFKPYNIALEFKFKNPRYTALNFKI